MSESESESNDEVEANEKKGIKLDPRQIEILAQNKQLGGEGTVVPKTEKQLINALAVDSEAVSSMDNPTVVDRGGLSRSALEDALASLRAVNQPVVVSESEAESLERARDGLASIVANAYGMSDDAAGRMSVDALASAVESYGEGDEGLKTMDQLSQSPESGSSHDIDVSAATPDGVEALSAGERIDLEQLVDKHELLKDRLPKRSGEIQREALEMVPGVDEWDELKREIE